MRYALACLLVLAAATPLQADELQHPVVYRARIDGDAITPVTARFIGRAIREAEQSHARYLVIELDTPGGLVSSTRKMVRNILDSDVSVVVYVSPSGARAASAGLFITLAADVAAMAPGTHIGAAHPVRIGAPPTAPKRDGDDDGGDVLDEKIESDTRAWARALAQLRGRNAGAAERAVSESLSLTASEAVAAGLVDLLATDFDELLGSLVGAEGAEVRTVEMGWGQRVLAALADPNLAFLLVMFGIYGLLFELYTAGFGVAGALGAICLMLGLVGLAVLPLNFAGVALVATGIALFVAEAFITSFGLLALGGVACFVLGGLMLIDSPAGFLRVSAYLVVPIGVATGLITVLLVGSVVKAHRARVQTGTEGLSLERAVAREAFARSNGDYTGTVLVHGEFWNAVSSEPVAAEQVVRIASHDGLTLRVEPHSLEREVSP